MLYRLRKRLNGFRFWYAARGIYRTPPTPCEPTADCTIHTMLGRADFLMYLVAIKSFLRFCPAARVTAHSDGSLTADDEASLRQHVPGIRVVSTTEANERARDALNPFLLEWRARDASWRRILDTQLWCETPRRVIIDSDILTIRKPEQVLDWIAGKGDGRPMLFGAPAGPPSGPIPEGSGKRHIQTIFREKLAAVAAALGRPAEFYQGATTGYYGCGNELSLAEVERVIRAGLAAGVPMAEWGGEQCVGVYVLSTSNPALLDPCKYLNFGPEAIGEPIPSRDEPVPALRNWASPSRRGIGRAAPIERLNEVAVAHFFGTYRYHRGVYPKLAREVVRELKTEAHK
jgi:hypothetical protein